MWKEVGTLIAFAGFVALLLGAFDLLLALPYFQGLAHPGVATRARRDGGWWIAMAISVFVPALTFYPFLLIGTFALPPNAVWPQSITNQIMVWAVLNALITLGVTRIFRSAAPRFETRWLASALIAASVVAIGYAALLLADRLFTVDFRFWVVALKLMSPAQFRAFWAYLPAFTAFFLVALGALHGNLAVRGDGAAAQYLTGIGAMALGFALFIAAEYAPLFTVGHVLIPAEALNAIVSIQFLPLLAIVGLISVFTWRRTNSPAPGAFICGLFVSWYMVAGTATQFQP
jgi:hypothetical protein